MLETLLELGLVPISMAQSSYDDWDDYHSRMMGAVEDWLDANPNHSDAAALRSGRIDGLRGALEQREASWALVAGRKSHTGGARWR
ncbi:hypothetical protein [Actinopolymorpha cephalotaxi]|nr:hypothetical protein [Actinopolymorpha cephalotaxi]NYH84246.1 hypothetical protein [Actinopolymorpha cephalotaxi]